MQDAVVRKSCLLDGEKFQRHDKCLVSVKYLEDGCYPLKICTEPNVSVSTQ